MRVNGKTAIVTGGGDGIGRAICLRLAEHGADVAVLDRSEQSATSVVEEIGRAGGRAVPVVADVSQEPQVQEAFAATVRAFGRLDVLVNNAGVPGPQKDTHELTIEEFDQVFDVNVKGVFLCTKHAIGPMRAAGGGSIVNISSITGLVGSRDLPIYHASKGAVRLMAKTDAIVYASDGIRVNSVHPGSVRTGLSDAAAASHPGGRDAYFSMLADLHPLGRQGSPDDIAYGVLYLASDESSFVTGSELVIDGGFTAQ